MPVYGPTTDHNEIRRWAKLQGAKPAEILPAVVDHIPAVLCFDLNERERDQPTIMAISWEDFFIKFDALGLSLVYDSDRPGYNEILQLDGKDPFISDAYRRLTEV